MRKPWLFTADGGAPPPTWAPPDSAVPLLAWYRADLGVTASSNLVTAWADQSGAADANRDQVAAGGLRPLRTVSDGSFGGKPSIGDNGTTQYLLSGGAWSASPTPPLSVLVVGISTGTSVSFMADATSGDMLWADASGFETLYSTGGGSKHGTVSTASACAILYTDDGSGGAAAAKLYVNDLSTPADTFTTSWTAATAIDLMKSVAGVGVLSGRMAEVIIWDGVLAGDLSDLVPYLNITRAYGLGVT